jgi:pimeloyl-ACP methyl ester carboxylesterase
VVLGYWAILLDSTPAAIEVLILNKLRTIDAPYLAIHGYPVADFYQGWLSEQLENLKFAIVPKGNHFPHLIDPKRFVLAIESML